MQETNGLGPTIIQKDAEAKNEPVVIQTDVGVKDGQNKCPKCGATDIALNARTGQLRCNYCRYEFNEQQLQGMVTDLTKLQGEIIGSGTQDINNDIQNVVTLKCESCGAEVVIDTNEVTQARCHWCRNTLSINQQIPNGSIPDIVLPFKLTREEAQKLIGDFVGKRKFFAHPKFRQEFTTSNIMGVYFPYMVVDANAHSNYIGKGEHLIRTYTIGSRDHRETRYDADLYQVARDFDITIEGLTIESSLDKLNQKTKDKTNNIINSIMPFDIENSVRWNANYLKGYTSEKRDTNIEQLRPLVDEQIKDVSRFTANKTLKNYDRGVCWESEKLALRGKQWKAAYLPVWIYSYQQKKGDKSILHYVAVNARTKETMGSVPIHMPKLIIMSILVEILGLIVMTLIDIEKISWLFLFWGIIYYFIMYSRYRNNDARHHHETETKSTMYNLKTIDNFIKRENGLSNSKIRGCNNEKISEQNIENNIIDTIKKNSKIKINIKNK